MSFGERRRRPVAEFAKLLRDHGENLVLVIVLGLILRVWFVGSFSISGLSMAPGLLEGDFVLAWRLPFGARIPGSDEKLIEGRRPRRGEVVVFRCGKEQCLRRVIGLPGDRLQMRKQRLLINQNPCLYDQAQVQGGQHLVIREACLGQSWAITWLEDASSSWGPLVVPPGQVAVLPDRRDALSAAPLLVPQARLEASAVWIWLSRGIYGLRWERMGARVY